MGAMENSWLNPLERIRFAKAVKARDESIKIGGYDLKLEYKQGKDGLEVHYAPTKGFVPCGWFPVGKSMF
jgi:hypothetical protein